MCRKNTHAINSTANECEIARGWLNHPSRGEMTERHTGQDTAGKGRRKNASATSFESYPGWYTHRNVHTVPISQQLFAFLWTIFLSGVSARFSTFTRWRTSTAPTAPAETPASASNRRRALQYQRRFRMVRSSQPRWGSRLPRGWRAFGRARRTGPEPTGATPTQVPSLSSRTGRGPPARGRCEEFDVLKVGWFVYVCGVLCGFC